MDEVISPAFRDRVAGRIAAGEGIGMPLAQRALDEALGFLRLCALDPGTRHSPSPLADAGWHALILFTREYAELCQGLAGRFIHHAPADGADCAGTSCTHGDCTSGGPPGDLAATGA